MLLEAVKPPNELFIWLSNWKQAKQEFFQTHPIAEILVSVALCVGCLCGIYNNNLKKTKTNRLMHEYLNK